MYKEIKFNLYSPVIPIFTHPTYINFFKKEFIYLFTQHSHTHTQSSLLDSKKKKGKMKKHFFEEKMKMKIDENM